jgi:hypothetical protein
MLFSPLDIKNEILVRLGASTTVAYYTDAIIHDWTTQSYRWVCGYKKWPQTEARISTTFASLITNEDGYLRGEYPEGWRADSIRLLTIGGKRVQKTNFYKFQEFLENNGSSDERIYTDQGRVYFVNPNIDLSGTITAWGQYTPLLDPDGNPTDTTVFSENGEEANEAIVLRALAIAHEREKKLQESTLYLNQAKELLEGLWQKIQAEQFAYQTADDEGIFKRLDVLGGATRDDLFKRDQFL